MYNWITLLCTWNFVRQLYINNICIYVYLLLLYIYFLYINIKKKKIKCIDHIWATVSTSCESQKENLEVLMLLKLLRTYKLMCMPREWRLASGRSKNRSWKGIHQGSPVHFKAPRNEERLLFRNGLITCSTLNSDTPSQIHIFKCFPTPFPRWWYLGVMAFSRRHSEDNQPCPI